MSAISGNGEDWMVTVPPEPPFSPEVQAKSSPMTRSAIQRRPVFSGGLRIIFCPAIYPAIIVLLHNNCAGTVIPSSTATADSHCASCNCENPDPEPGAFFKPGSPCNPGFRFWCGLQRGNQRGLPHLNEIWHGLISVCPLIAGLV